MSEHASEKQKKGEQELDERLRDLDSSDLPDANIVLAGITGAGKSTLVNAVFGDNTAKTGTGEPVTSEVKEYSGKDTHINIWDTVGLELDGAKTEQSIQNIKRVIDVKAKGEDPFDRIHAIWYCINSGSNRYQGKELRFIQELHSVGVPFIIVLTQCIGTSVDQFESEIRRINGEMGIHDVDIVKVLAKDYIISIGPQTVTVPKSGLDELVNVTMGRLPEYIRSGFAAAQKVSQGMKRTAAEDIIAQCVQAANEGLFDKLFLVNIAVADKRIRNMLAKIGKVYNMVLSDQALSRIQTQCHIDFKNVWSALIAPKQKYSSKIKKLLEKERTEGFRADIDVENADRVAKMVVFYGYTFIDSLEELWEKLTEDQLNEIDVVIEKLIQTINEKLGNNLNGPGTAE